MKAEFQRKEAEVNVWLVLHWHDDEAAAYEKLRDELRGAGWDDDGLRGLPPINGQNEITLVRHGSAMFNGQTQEEATLFVAQCRPILRKHNLVAGRIRTRNWQDFLYESHHQTRRRAE